MYSMAPAYQGNNDLSMTTEYWWNLFFSGLDWFKEKKTPHQSHFLPILFFFLLRYLSFSFNVFHKWTLSTSQYRALSLVCTVLLWFFQYMMTMSLSHRCTTSYAFLFFSLCTVAWYRSAHLFFLSSSPRHLFDIKSWRTGGFFGQIDEHEAMISLLLFSLSLFFFFRLQ